MHTTESVKNNAMPEVYGKKGLCGNGNFLSQRTFNLLRQVD